MDETQGFGVFTTDRDLSIRSWNEWLVAATGLAESRVHGRPLDEITGAGDDTWYRDVFDEVLDTGNPRVLAAAFHRYLIPCAPRTPSEHFDRMQQRVTVAPLRSDDALVGVIVTIEDVTERLDAERRVAARLQTQGEGGSVEHALAAVGADDWRLRRAAVEALRRSASYGDVRHLLESLKREHDNLNVLSSALQVLNAAHLDVGPALIELLADPDANLRMHAALALGELRSVDGLPALVGALDDPDINVRFHAIEALGRLSVPEAVEPLAAIAESGDFFLAFAAVDALARLDDVRVAPRLVRMLGQDMLRPAVIDTLAALGDEDCIPPLVELLNAGEGDAAAIAGAMARIHARYDDAYDAGAHIVDLVRASITADGIGRLAAALERRNAPLKPLVMVLGWVGADALGALVGVLDEPTVQASVAGALVEIGRPAVDPLMTRLATGERDVRLAAAALLGRLGDRRAVPVLAELLSVPDVDLVATAAAALASLGDPRALDDLLPLFAHEHASVRQAAIAAVNSIGAQGTASRMRARLTDPDPRVRESAVRVAGYFGFEECVPGILTALDDPHEDVRRAALEQLPVVEDPRAVPRLVAALRTETPRNRAAAAHALRSVSDEAATLGLRTALEDPDAWVRYFAVGSLALRGDTAASPALVRLARQDAATPVRIAAVQALGTLDAAAVTDVASELMRDPDPDLAGAAIAALAGARGGDIERLLEEAVCSSNVECRAAAVQALAARPGSRAIGVLIWAARADEPPGIASVAIEGLRRIAASDEADGRTAAIQALLEVASEPGRRDEIVEALGSLKVEAIDSIAAGLSAPAPGLRTTAVEALGRMRHPRASESLALALDDPDAAVRTAAVTVFGRLGTHAVSDTIATMQRSDPDAGVRRRAAAICARHGWSTRR